MAIKVESLTYSNQEYELIPPLPTATERGGILAEAKDASYVTEVKLGSDGKLYVPKTSDGDASGTMSLKFDEANKAVVFENVSMDNLAAAGLEHLGITATAEELNYMDGVTSNVQTQFTDAHNRANKFFPDFAMHSIVTDCLNVSIVDDWPTSSVNRDGVIATEDVSTLINSPIDSGAFYAYRTVRQVECAGRNPKTIVTLTEAYPMAGRVWIRAYNPDTSSWNDNWVSHTDACTYRDNAKTITDIITNSIVYVCDPTRAVTKPICASEFTTGDGHNLTQKQDMITGSYTGNGSATSRTISVGGVGNVILIYRDDKKTLALITPAGGLILVTVSGAQANYPISSSEASFNNGVLTLATASGNINNNGSKFYYQVL